MDSLLRTQQLLDEARASGEARVKAVEVERAKELVRDRTSRGQRNEARAELVALRTQQSAAAVRSALAPIFPLPAE
jgi:hypothetical protein